MSRAYLNGDGQPSSQSANSPLANYTLPGVINYLTSEFTNLERFKIMNNLEKNEMKYQLIQLQSEINALKFINDKQLKKIQLLEQENNRLKQQNGHSEQKNLSLDDTSIPDVDLQIIKQARSQLTKSMAEVIHLLKTPSVSNANYLNFPDPDNSFESNQFEELFAQDNFTFHDNFAQPTLPSKKIQKEKEQTEQIEQNDIEPVVELKNGQFLPVEETDVSDAETVMEEKEPLEEVSGRPEHPESPERAISPEALASPELDQITLNILSITPGAQVYGDRNYIITYDNTTLVLYTSSQDQIFSQPVEISQQILRIYCIVANTSQNLYKLVVVGQESVDFLVFSDLECKKTIVFNGASMPSSKIGAVDLIPFEFKSSETFKYWGIAFSVNNGANSFIKAMELSANTETPGVSDREVAKLKIQSTDFVKWAKTNSIKKLSPNKNKSKRTPEELPLGYDLLYRQEDKLYNFISLKKKPSLELAKDSKLLHSGDFVVYSTPQEFKVFNPSLLKVSECSISGVFRHITILGEQIVVVSANNSNLEVYDSNLNKIKTFLLHGLEGTFTALQGSDKILLQSEDTLAVIDGLE